jgi:hypothetical protein
MHEAQSWVVNSIVLGMKEINFPRNFPPKFFFIKVLDGGVYV